MLSNVYRGGNRSWFKDIIRIHKLQILPLRHAQSIITSRTRTSIILMYHLNSIVIFRIRMGDVRSAIS